MKKIVLLIISILSVTIQSFAWEYESPDFEVDGFYYLINNKNSNEVWLMCGKGNGDPRNPIVPSIVNYDGKSYTVTAVYGNPYFSYDHNDTLETITLPNTIKSIVSGAFQGCRNLREFKIPPLVTIIGNSTFYGCTSLESVELSPNLQDIGSYAFHGCSALKSISFPSSLTSLGSNAFEGCTSLKFPEDMLENISVIEDGTFKDCSSLKSVNLSPTITTIGSSAFSGCTSLLSIKIPENAILKSINERAFYGCSSLTEITIPEKVSIVGNEAFINCTSLERIFCYPVEPPSPGFHGANVFDLGTYQNAILYVPNSSLSLYKRSEPWIWFVGNIKPLEESGVESVVYANEGYFRVFDLKGANILNTSNKSEIDNLSPGIYIINGKKTVVK